MVVAYDEVLKYLEQQGSTSNGGVMNASIGSLATSQTNSNKSNLSNNSIRLLIIAIIPKSLGNLRLPLSAMMDLNAEGGLMGFSNQINHHPIIAAHSTTHCWLSWTW